MTTQTQTKTERELVWERVDTFAQARSAVYKLPSGRFEALSACPDDVSRSEHAMLADALRHLGERVGRS